MIIGLIVALISLCSYINIIQIPDRVESKALKDTISFDYVKKEKAIKVNQEEIINLNYDNKVIKESDETERLKQNQNVDNNKEKSNVNTFKRKLKK